MALSSFRGGAPSSVYPLARASTVDLIATELRSAIFSGALPVGGALREVEISAQLGVSRSPLREAAQRLVQEGLLTAVPGRGLRVSSISAAAVADLYIERLAIEAQAVRVITESLPDEVHVTRVDRIASALDELERASARGEAWEIGDADLAFHQTLVDAADSRRLSKAMMTLAYETRIASLSSAEGYTVRRSVSATYPRLIDALQQRDTTTAIAALKKQFDDAVKRLQGKDDSVDTVETEVEHEPQQFEPLSTDSFE
ncbi:MAG: GntR family transcriptional regulator [Leucobacter sp.]|jgi:DNA-binding GntR family transcriptional regulator|nr:GntR family transcriptional regulator [Leucobacter sp.]